MSVENLRIDEPGSKGWANLYMNNLKVYNDLTVCGTLKDGSGNQVIGVPEVGVAGIYSRDVPGEDPEFRPLVKNDVHPILDSAGVLKSVASGGAFALAIEPEAPGGVEQTFYSTQYTANTETGTISPVVDFLKTGRQVTVRMSAFSMSPGNVSAINLIPNTPLPAAFAITGGVAELPYLNKIIDATSDEIGRLKFTTSKIEIKRRANQSFPASTGWSSHNGFTFTYIAEA